MIKKIKIYPKNKSHFIKLKRFGKQIINILNKIDANPIIYGGLGFFAYSKNKDVIIRDIDIFIQEKFFSKFIEILNQKKISHKYHKKWHTIQIFKDGLKLEIDSKDFWYKGSGKNRKFDFNGFQVNILILNEIIAIYEYASKYSDKKLKNKKKFESLQNLK